MKKGEILNMQAGQDMDMLISEKVLCLTVDDWNWRFFANKTHYSTELGCTQEVIDALAKPPFSWHIESTNHEGGVSWWACLWEDCEDGVDDFLVYAANAETVPLAVCRAALLCAFERHDLYEISETKE